MGLVKFYHGAKLPTSPDSDTLYFLSSGEIYKGTNLVADTTDTVAIQSMIDDAIGGIGKAVRFIGHSSTTITDGGNEKPTIDGKAFTEISAGDVVLYGNQEFICNASSKWELFGDEGSYATITALEELSQEVDKIVAGTVKVESATRADSAANADNATNAENAENAVHAGTADEATHAASANTAIQANQALVASEAHYAVSAGTSASANHATIADNATHADNATNAENAENATNAENADEAQHALSSDFAIDAEKAGALKLTEAVGTSKKPVYFNNDGRPVAIDYTIESSVPADAKFTDTVSAITSTTGNGNAVTEISVSNGQFTIAKGSTFALNDDLQILITALTWETV